MSEPFTDFEQISMKVEAAKKMVGSATMSLDPELMEHAATALQEARSQLDKMKAVATDLDEPFLHNQESMLTQIEHQLSEARQ